MKEMVYSKTQKREVLDKGIYINFEYWILSLGTHPVAYIKTKEKIKDGDIERIEVHGGITYNEETLNISEEEQLKGNFIGWDYSHCMDYNGMFDFGDTKKWTTEEIMEDVRKVVAQLIGGIK